MHTQLMELFFSSYAECIPSLVSCQCTHSQAQPHTEHHAMHGRGGGGQAVGRIEMRRGSIKPVAWQV